MSIKANFTGGNVADRWPGVLCRKQKKKKKLKTKAFRSKTYFGLQQRRLQRDDYIFSNTHFLSAGSC